MARRIVMLASAACLALGVAACGGGDDAGAPGAADAGADATAPEQATPPEREESPRRRSKERERDDTGAGAEDRDVREREAVDDRAEDTEGGSGDSRDRRAERRDDDDRPRADDGSAEVQRTVRTIVGLISSGDARVCRRYFTLRYAEFVSDRNGEAAFRRCESDIARSKGKLKVLDFQETGVDGDRASVRFRLEVEGTVTREGWRMVRREDRWVLDGQR